MHLWPPGYEEQEPAAVSLHGDRATRRGHPLSVKDLRSEQSISILGESRLRGSPRTNHHGQVNPLWVGVVDEIKVCASFSAGPPGSRSDHRDISRRHEVALDHRQSRPIERVLTSDPQDAPSRCREKAGLVGCVCETGFTRDVKSTHSFRCAFAGLRLKLQADGADVFRRRGAGRRDRRDIGRSPRGVSKAALRAWRPRNSLPRFCRHDALFGKPPRPCRL